MSIFLSNNIIALLFIEAILFIFAIVSIIISINILKNWDFNSTLPKQYNLEKKNYLVSTIIFFTILAKIVLFIFFVKSLDGLSNIVPGAMCAAGIVNANDYGNILLFLKLFIIFGFGVWIIFNKLDLKATTYPYLKHKYYLFSFLFLLVCLELILEVLYFSNISIETPVLCCSVVFGTSDVVNGLPFGLNTTLLLILFYLFFVLVLLSSFNENSMINFISNSLFLFVAYYAVTYFFGTYIYELPTHKCPFCMLQKEYFYIGYILWSSLFLGVFFGISSFILKLTINKEFNLTYKYTLFFNTIFVLLCTYYVVGYYIKNGVFL